MVAIHERTTPQIDLHAHLEATFTPEELATGARKLGVTEARNKYSKAVIPVDPQDPASITDLLDRNRAAGYPGKDGMNRFLEGIGLGLVGIKTLEDLTDGVYQQLLRLSQSNLHTELRGSPLTYVGHINGLNDEKVNAQQVLTAITAGFKRAYEEQGISGSFIACTSRQRGIDEAAAVAKAIVEFNKTQTEDHKVAFDIAGAPEQGFEPAMFADIIKFLQENGVNITIHCGEQGSPENGFETASPELIRDAVRMGIKRIGHGLAAMIDAELIAELATQRIHIETCPTSNDSMGFVKIKQHPLKKFLDAGVPATVNTDDALMFGKYTPGEILEKHFEDLKLEPQDVLQLIRSGIDAAFVSNFRRAKLNVKFGQFLDKMAA